MLKTNSANRVSPTEQMYVFNRIVGIGDQSRGMPGLAGMAGLDPITGVVDGVVSVFKKLGGLFTKDPNRDIHIPAQDAAVTGFADVLNQIEAQRVQGTLTRDALNRAIYSIQQIYGQFTALTNDLSQRYPDNRSRYQAGQSEVVALGRRLVVDLNNKFAGQLSATPSLSDIANRITSFLPSGISPVILLAGAFFIVPRLLKR